jgi:hypothetical protein
VNVASDREANDTTYTAINKRAVRKRKKPSSQQQHTQIAESGPKARVEFTDEFVRNAARPAQGQII